MKSNTVPVITVRGLRKNYGEIQALTGIDFQILRGEIFGMVGPNGAGKTTTIECIEGLRKPDGGTIEVLGLDPVHHLKDLKPNIGIQLQQTALPRRIKVREALQLYASFYGKSLEAGELISRLGLEGILNKYFGTLSGGQKQRLFIALALLHDPEIIFLDELTTGLDPRARRNMWGLVREVRDAGKTVFLTTHFMEEAERLCDRVAIIDKGAIKVLDTPGNLIRKHGAGRRLLFTLDSPNSLRGLENFSSIARIEKDRERIIVYGESDQMIADCVNFLTKEHVAFRDLRTEQSTLDDVFLSLTGHDINNQEDV